ncbi:MAG: molybdate ABC transporter substrate-binding protein [Cellvibrionales bacterium]|nr:molybdate ABC transporter substrate-binding protein [Cellvibrionales bacterium]
MIHYQKHLVWLLFALVGLGVFLLIPTKSSNDQALIAVASNFKPVADLLANQFYAETHQHVEIISGASGKLYAQIVQGAPFDAFFSAESTYPGLLVQKKLAIMGSEFIYANGKLVVVARKGLGQDLVSMIRSAKKIAIANPQHAPYGVAAQDVLSALSLLESLDNRLVFAENIAQVYQYVISGAVDLAFVSESLVRMNPERLPDQWQWLPVDPSWYEPIRQTCVQVSHKASAKAFLAYILTPSVKHQLMQLGYDVYGIE